MFTLTVKSNLGQFQKEFAAAVEKQVRFATAVALTRTAQKVKEAEIAEMAAVFQNPTPYTLNSLYMKPATKANLKASVWLKYDSSKGTPAEKYLLPQIMGGQRRLKRFEVALNRIGVLPSGMAIVPSNAVELDSYGNVPRGLIVRILSYFQAFGEQGYSANMSDAKRKRMAKGTKKSTGTAYFSLQRPRGKLPPGIYQRFHFAHGSAIRPVFIFVRTPSYSRIFDFYGVAERIARATYPGEFQRAFAQAMATAR